MLGEISMPRRHAFALFIALIVVALYAVGCSSTSSLGITGAFAPSATVGTAYTSSQFTAVKGSGTYAWSATGLPPGLTTSGANSAMFTVAGTPTTAGTYTASVTVTDSSGRTVTSTGTITVSASTSTLTINGTLPLTGSVGTAYAGTLTATGGSGTYTWKIEGLPDGLTATNSTSATVTVAGSPTAAKSYQVTITLTDSANNTAASSETLQISSAPVLTITGALSPTATVATAFTGSLTATGGTTPYAWSVTGLPADVTATNTGAATVTIAGTPQTAGTYDVSAIVTDHKNATANYSVTIVVSAAQSAANSACIATRPLLGSEDGLTRPYAFVLSNTDFNGTPLSWAGSFTPDGKGGIQVADLDQISAASGPASYRVNLLGSSYSLGADGSGCLSLALDGVNDVSATQNLGAHTPNLTLGGNAKTALAAGDSASPAPATTFTMLFIVSGQRAGLATQSDPNNKRVAAAGNIFAQQSSDFELNALAPRFAFGAAGWYLAPGSEIERAAMAGTIATIVPAGSSAAAFADGVADQNIGGDVSGELNGARGMLSVPSQDTGRGEGTYSVETPRGEVSFEFAYYVIDGGDFIFISTDAAEAGNLILTGRALKSAAPATSLAGSYVADMYGIATNEPERPRETTLQIGNLTATVDNRSEWTLSTGNYDKPLIQNFLGGMETDSATGRTIFNSASGALPVAYLTAPAASPISSQKIAGFLVGADDFVAAGTLLSIPTPTAP
jgi:hypothetical protein